MNNDIKTAIERGQLVLFLGAGASRNCLDRYGNSLLDGSDLAKHLADRIGISYQEETLSLVYSAAKEALGSVALNAELEKLYRHCQPSASYISLSRFCWPRIYTINIDDAFENAQRKNSPQLLNVRYRNDMFSDRDQLFGELDFVKLNGSSDRLSDGLIFSMDEYAVSSVDLPDWYSELANDYFSFKFLFIGTKLNEPLFRHAIEEYKRRYHEDAGESFLMVPELSDIESMSLKAGKLTHIPASLEQFTEWLGENFPKVPSAFDLVRKNRPEIDELLKEADDVKDQDKLETLNDIAPISRSNLSLLAGPPSDSAVRKFYRGFKPTWRDLLDDVPASLEVEGRILERITTLKTNKRIVAVFGPAGSGKTTTIMKAALILSESVKYPVYFVVDVVKNFVKLITLLEKLNESTYYLFTDQLDNLSKGIIEVCEKEIMKKGIVVGSERQNIWRIRTSEKLDKYCSQPISMGKISEKDGKNILTKLEKYGYWQRLEKKNPDERLKILLEKSNRQMLIGLLEATYGQGFEEIIDADYKRIDDHDSRKFLLLVGLATANRLGMPEGLLGRATQQLGLVASPRSYLSRLGGIVHLVNNKYWVRHPVYMNFILERCAETNDLTAVLSALLRAFSAYGSPVAYRAPRLEANIFRTLVNRKFMHRCFGDWKIELSVYKQFEKAFSGDGLYWLQYALCLRDAGIQKEALEKNKLAYEVYPSDHTQHGLAQQYLILGVESAIKNESLNYLGKAIDLLKLLDSRLGEVSAYPIVTLSEGHLQISKKFDGDTTARKLAKGYLEDLTEKLRKMPNNLRLKNARLRLLNFVATGSWRDRKIDEYLEF